MSEKINDGGPAFPPHTSGHTHHTGMSLRDWLAGQALVGLLSDSKHDDTVSRVADVAYTIADAMLKARGE